MQRLIIVAKLEAILEITNNDTEDRLLTQEIKRFKDLFESLEVYQKLVNNKISTRTN